MIREYLGECKYLDKILPNMLVGEYRIKYQYD